MSDLGLQGVGPHAPLQVRREGVLVRPGFCELVRILIAIHGRGLLFQTQIADPVPQRWQPLLARQSFLVRGPQLASELFLSISGTRKGALPLDPNSQHVVQA